MLLPPLQQVLHTESLLMPLLLAAVAGCSSLASRRRLPPLLAPHLIYCDIQRKPSP
jgi:hypothetical protein